MIDFSVPDGAEMAIATCVQNRVPLVMATTGLTPAIREKLVEAALVIPVVWSPSMSLTVNLAMKLVATAGTALKDTPSGVDVEIVERHHRMKEDSPSGTALKFGEIVAGAMGQTQHQHGREGMIGKRPRNEIGYHAVRTGDNPGEHTIIFGLMGETLEVTVKASNCDCYALGRIASSQVRRPAKKPGMYNMYDVLASFRRCLPCATAGLQSSAVAKNNRTKQPCSSKPP
ncbi:MAG: 4-hydroxy-tetrahydrodipicolinate reductase [Pirellulales bacterium]